VPAHHQDARRRATPSGPHRSALRWALALGLAGVTALAGTAPAVAGSVPAGSVPPDGPTSAAVLLTPDVTAAPALPLPAVPPNLPGGIEDPSPYVKQASCDPVPKPGAVALSTLLVTTYPGTSAAISRDCGLDGIASEHYEGRAVDWMTSLRDPVGAARAQAVVSWLLATDTQGHAFANARRLGVMYVIWNDRIWGSYAASAGWRPYSTCAAHPDPAWDTSCHRDHVHLSLSWAGALGRTSFWTGQVGAVDYGPCRSADLNWAPVHGARTAQPCPAYPAVAARAGVSPLLASIVRFSGATVGPGSHGPVVTAVQKAVGVDADGAFGPLTGVAVQAFRSARHLPAGTTVDAAVWRALLAAPPSGDGGAASGAAPAPSGSGGTAPAGAPAATGPSSGPSSGAGTVGGPASGPLGAFPGGTLAYGSTGTAVQAVQRALRVTPVSGWFGPVTRAAVTAFQAAHHLPVTGAVDAVTWCLLGR